MGDWAFSEEIPYFAIQNWGVLAEAEDAMD